MAYEIGIEMGNSVVTAAKIDREALIAYAKDTERWKEKDSGNFIAEVVSAMKNII